MRDGNPKTIYLDDYTTPNYWIESTQLRFTLGENATQVESSLQLRRNPEHNDASLFLHGEGLALKHIAIDGAELDENRYEHSETGLTLHQLPEQCVLTTVVEIHPENNTALEGLYQSSGNFCTQCEAEGFRRITFYLDRPDVLSRFTTTIVADKQKYPVLLSNGNPVDSGDNDDGRHWVTWEDPHLKPAYLFAMVAGDLSCIEDSYTTTEGREVALRIYVEAHNADKCDHAMQSLKKAMQWDEETFGLSYDLDIYMIVAVDDFNMGAMENKGLNVFNSKFVLARPDTATDTDFINIEAVIAHEYFHNWTGNRVTCRDWFQLSLKEGLTVFRDQQFTADMQSAAVKRIDDVRMLRTHQFAEDASPMAHPVRPDHFIEINNFYTVTVYEKGAEIVRLYHSLLGPDGFRKGMDLYFERHDGQAVTVEDFAAAMGDANGEDFSHQFQNWYKQSGTPRLAVKSEWDAANGRYTLHFTQRASDKVDSSHFGDYLLPIKYKLLGDALNQTEQTLVMKEKEVSLTFNDLQQEPLPSLLRGFSAPVILEHDYSEDDLMRLMQLEDDSFNRWEAAQRLVINTSLPLIEEFGHAHALGVSTDFLDAFRFVLRDFDADPALIAETMTLPDEGYLQSFCSPVNPEAIHAVREFMRKTLAKTLQDCFLKRYAMAKQDRYDLSSESIAKRRLRNVCLSYLLEVEDATYYDMALEQFKQADNMTDQLAAFSALAQHEVDQRDEVIELFYGQWKGEALVMDKWFAIQSGSRLPSTLDRVQELMQHELFNIKNPNRVRSVLGAFAQNHAQFHREDGAAYEWFTDQMITLDSINPQITARLAKVLSRWRIYTDDRQEKMRVCLERIAGQKNLSKDVYEIVSRSLEDK